MRVYMPPGKFGFPIGDIFPKSLAASPIKCVNQVKEELFKALSRKRPDSKPSLTGIIENLLIDTSVRTNSSISLAADSDLDDASAHGPKAPKRRGRVLLFLLSVWLFAFALRAEFVIEVFANSTEEQVLKLHYDSREYHHLARNLAETGQYQIDTHESRFFALLRTPGYPAIVALFFKLGLGIKGLIWGQAILGSLIPPLVFLLGRWIFCDLLFASLAGVIAALSTTGIGLSAMLLADLPFAFTIISGFALLYLGASGRRWAWMTAGVIFSLSILIKPATMYFAPALAIAWWMIARSNRLPMRWPALFWVLVAPYIAVGFWSLHNHSQTGHWVFSTVDAQNLRHFLAPLTDEINKAGGLPMANL